MLYEKDLTQKIIAAAIEVHRHLGPGLLESAYQVCLAHELGLQGLEYQRELPVPLVYKGINLDCGYRLDFLVSGKIILELKAVDALQPIHEAQMLTYLRLTGCKIGLLINFNTPVLKDGLKRLVL